MQKRLPSEALLVASAMSRLDADYIRARGLSSWKNAYAEASTALNCKATSIKLLRDEFDPLFPNSRSGWHKRDVRPEIKRTFEEIAILEEDLHLELVNAVLGGKQEEIAPVVAVIDPEETPAAVAQRLRTGRLAEEWFMVEGHKSVQQASRGIIDHRLDALGYDFKTLGNTNYAIEVKGLAGVQGNILITAKERSVAQEMGDYYLLAVITQISESPRLHIVKNPAQSIELIPSTTVVQTKAWKSNMSSSTLRGFYVS
ncbi:MAG TPA: DUF3883 domain-containing protein [Fimbriimonadaceae bacterium]|nr:DUF3883 domain-containing protein [Fimbriimonadaceae bacterium]